MELLDRLMGNASPFPVQQGWGRKEPSYITKLSPPEEHAFLTDVKTGKLGKYAEETLQQGEQADYDLRGFWKGLQEGDPRAVVGIDPNDQEVHMTDTWKTPYHKTFSDESIYATPDAPAWNRKDQLLNRQTGQVLFDDRLQRLPFLPGTAGLTNEQELSSLPLGPDPLALSLLQLMLRGGGL